MLEQPWNAAFARFVDAGMHPYVTYFIHLATMPCVYFLQTTQLTGTVDDCCIDFRTVDLATRDYFLPLLRSLQHSTFFKYFKVDLSKDCPFWHEDGQCVERACALDECDPKDIPRQWLEQDIITDKSSRIGQLAR
jgi:Endoplasmic Reticulum Oxidoreductin 1 (ERO1)